MAALHRSHHRLYHRQIGRVGIEDTGAVLCAYIIALTVDGQRIDTFEIYKQELGEAYYIIIVGHLYSLGRPGIARTHHFICRLGNDTVGIARHSLINSVYQRKQMGGAPEAAAGKEYLLYHYVSICLI